MVYKFSQLAILLKAELSNLKAICGHLINLTNCRFLPLCHHFIYGLL